MPVPTATAPIDRAGFLDAIRVTGLLTAAQLTRAEALAPSGSAADVARALVAGGVLTRFQAERLLTGRTDGFFLGQYAVLEPIGRGAMSRVYKAKHRTMNRQVAIKVLSSELTRTADERQTFQAGVRAAGKLAHPNIVTAYDANELHDRFYLVLEFVDGPNLGALVSQRGPLPVAEACEYVRQTASGLRHAHEQGMLHRDIKPTNLLVARPTPSAPLVVKIADFGIPKGTPRDGASAFAAPEARAGAPVDSRSDLYSLGCVFYFLLTGRAPGPSPTPVGQFRSDVPPEVGAILSWLLAPQPAARTTSAAELLLQLDAACVTVATALEEVSFDLPAYPMYPGQDSGYLTGRHALPHSGFHPAAQSGAHPQPNSRSVPPAAASLSPWAQLSEAVSEDTRPIRPDDTPTPALPHAKPKPPEKRKSVPVWMTLSLLVGIVLLCMMGINAAIKTLVK